MVLKTKDVKKKGMIRYYMLRKYERFKDMPLDDLIDVRAKVDAGLIDLKKENYADGRMNGHAKRKAKKEDPNRDDTLDKELGIRNFMKRARESTRVQAMIEKRSDDMSFFRSIYSISDITRNEICFLFGIPLSTLNYYTTKYKITKIPLEARVRMNGVDDVVKLFEKPRFKFTRPNSNETKEEFKDRYKALTHTAFGRLQNIIHYGEEEENESKVINTAISALGALMKVEQDAKGLLNTEKDEVIKLKRDELAKNTDKTPVVINFGGDISLQSTFLKMKELLEAKGIDESELSDLMLELKDGVEDAELV